MICVRVGRYGHEGWLFALEKDPIYEESPRKGLCAAIQLVPRPSSRVARSCNVAGFASVETTWSKTGKKEKRTKSVHLLLQSDRYLAYAHAPLRVRMVLSVIRYWFVFASLLLRWLMVLPLFSWHGFFRVGLQLLPRRQGMLPSLLFCFLSFSRSLLRWLRRRLNEPVKPAPCRPCRDGMGWDGMGWIRMVGLSLFFRLRPQKLA